MNKRLNRYVATSLFGLALIASGCAARGVNVRAPIDGRATVEGDSSSARGRDSSATTGSRTDQSTTRSGSASGSMSESGSSSR
jgi:hypothetical protein